MSTTIVAPESAYRKVTRRDVREYRRAVRDLPASHVSITINPLDGSELFVQAPHLPVLDLPDVRPLLPPEWRDAPVHRFEPNREGGAWVLRPDVPPEHGVRTWGGRTDWCACTSCAAYREARFDLLVSIGTDALIADALDGE